MTLTHPICQASSLIGSIAYAVNLCGFRGVFFCLEYALPIILLTAFFLMIAAESMLEKLDRIKEKYGIIGT